MTSHAYTSPTGHYKLYYKNDLIDTHLTHAQAADKVAYYADRYSNNVGDWPLDPDDLRVTPE